MPLRYDIFEGQLLRLIADCYDVPKDTLATVETVQTLRDGTWVFTVTWDDYIAPSRRKYASNRSLNLWESDLSRFEIVTDPTTVDLSPSRSRKHPFKPVTPRHQLELPFQENDALVLPTLGTEL